MRRTCTIPGPAVTGHGALPGLPHYTHLLTQLAAQAALGERHVDVGAAEVDFAVERAIQRAQQSVTEAYLRAETAGAVLLAAALAEDDEFGFFGNPMRPPTSSRSRDGRRDDAQRTRPTRSELGILQAREAATGRRYRFTNPLLPPYVVMRGFAAAGQHPRDLR